MQIGVMVTDGGPHPPEKWAEVTASHIIDISATAPEAKLKEAREFRDKITGILTGHHANNIRRERNKLAAGTDDHFATALDPTETVEEAVAEIIAASKGLSFAAHFEKLETQQYLRNAIGSHMATAQHIERMWASDDTDAARDHRTKVGIPHPDHSGKHLVAYRAQHAPEP